MADKALVPLREALCGESGRLSRRVLEFVSVMDDVVNRDKQPPITAADWEPLAEFVDPERFFRIGNFGERVDWVEYLDLLVQWANSSWWRGYIWRIRELPSTVFLETQERSNPQGPVREDGPYQVLDSIAVYEFDGTDKITGLCVYDQRPLEA